MIRLDKDYIPGSGEELDAAGAPEETAAAEEIIEEAAEETVEDAVDEVSESEDITADEDEIEDAEEDTQEDAEEDGSPEEPERVRICPNCHKNAMARGHRYCRKCEKKIIKVRAPLGGYIAGFVSLITALCAFVLAFLLMPASLQVAQGDFFAARHNWYSAGMSYNGVSDVITQVTDSVGENSPLKQVIATGSNFDFKIYKTLVNMYGLFRANQAKSNIFKSPGSAEFTAKSNKLAVYDAMFEKFSNTYQAVSDIMTEIDYSETRDKKLGEESVKKMEAARGKEGVDDIALDYFIANVIMACDMGDDLEREQLEKVKAKDEATEEDYSWLYYEDLIKFYMKTKDYDKALPLIEAELKKNTSNFTPAYCKAKIIASKGDTKALEDFIGEFCRNNTNLDGSQSDSNYSLLIYYLRVTGDYSHAKDMIEQAKSVYNLNSDFDRQLALVCLVEGDYDAAFEAIWAAEESANYRAQMYQDSSAYTEEFFATSYLAAYMCDKYGNKDSENASHLPEVLEYYKDGAPNDTVDKIIKGELTIEKVLTEGVYDVA